MKRALMLAGLLAACGESAPAEPRCREPEEGSLPARVRIAAEAVESMGIVTAAARAGASVPAGTIPAEVALVPSRAARVSSLVDGRLEELAVELGARVSAGEVLATVSSIAVADLAAATQQARARAIVAEAAVERLSALGDIAAQRRSIEARAELAQARAELAGLSRQRRVLDTASGRARLVAPIAGEVIAIEAQRGDALTPGEVVVVIADVSRVWVIGHAPEMLAPALHEGAAVRLRLFAFGAERWPSALSYLAPILDGTSHTLMVRAELDNDGRLRPGMLGVLELVARDLPGRVSVPRSAVVSVADQEVVFVATGHPGDFAVRPVALERADADEAVIAAGLEAGEEVVTEGAFILESELARERLEEGEH